MLDVQDLYVDDAFRPGLFVQPLTTNHLSHGATEGGNAMGFSDNDGPLISELTLSTTQNS